MSFFPDQIREVGKNTDPKQVNPGPGSYNPQPPTKNNSFNISEIPFGSSQKRTIFEVNQNDLHEYSEPLRNPREIRFTEKLKKLKNGVKKSPVRKKVEKKPKKVVKKPGPGDYYVDPVQRKIDHIKYLKDLQRVHKKFKSDHNHRRLRRMFRNQRVGDGGGMGHGGGPSIPMNQKNYHVLFKTSKLKISHF